MKRLVIVMLSLLGATAAAADCPPVVAYEYCQVGCEDLGRWVVVGVSSPETARGSLMPIQLQTATVMRIFGGQSDYAMVVREMASEPIDQAAWGWQWQVYAGPNAALIAAAEAGSSDHIVTTVDGAVLRVWWQPCVEQRLARSRGARTGQIR